MVLRSRWFISRTGSVATAAKRICAKPGCFAVAVKRSRCKDHQPKAMHNWTADYDKTRPSRHERGYGSRWAKASKNYLKAHPLCTNCNAYERLRPATLVDHIEPHRGDKALFWDVSNWQGLCKACHAVKTGRGL